MAAAPKAPTVALCLACAASLPPRTAGDDVHLTSCCSRPICPSCIAKNPRLVRYSPCLRCLSGVGAVSARSPILPGGDTPHSVDGRGHRSVNVDGSLRDDDVFVLGDDGEEESEDVPEMAAPTPLRPSRTVEASVSTSDPRETASEHLEGPERHLTTEHAGASQPSSEQPAEGANEGDRDATPAMAIGSRYYILPDDTLHAISLKLGVDSRVLCRLNNLPPSTLRTTPHLLHTREYLQLPPGIARPSNPPTPSQLAEEETRKAKRALERAETRFQAMTKEVDRDVAKAYVAVAALRLDDQDSKEYEKKSAARGSDVPGHAEGGLEGRAMDKYFDDDEWEGGERRRAALPSFPYFSRGSGSSTGVAMGKRPLLWRWGS